MRKSGGMRRGIRGGRRATMVTDGTVVGAVIRGMMTTEPVALSFQRRIL
jgi:hypothetical protein